MKKISQLILLLSLSLTALVSCDKDIENPMVMEIYDGLYIYGSATPFASLDNNGNMIAGDEVGKASKFVELKSGDLNISWEHNTTKEVPNSTPYGMNGENQLIQDGSPIVFSLETGNYLINVDVDSKAVSYSAIEGWGVIGDATPGSWDNDTDMTLQSYENGIYTYTCTLELIGGKKFKFRANNGWDINLGGEANGMNFGGDNIVVEQSGNYTITLKLGRKYTYTISKN